MQLHKRLPMIWLSLLTIYQSYVTTDALSVLRQVESSQEYTLKYMEKSCSILKRFKKVRIPGEPAPVPAQATAAAEKKADAS